MRRLIPTLLQAWAVRGRERRRHANLRAGSARTSRLTRDGAGRGRREVAGSGAAPAWKGLMAAALQRKRQHGLPAAWLYGALLLATLAGALLIAGHARHLALSAPAPQAGAERAVAALQGALPGMSFEVPGPPGVVVKRSQDGALLVLSGLQAAAPVRVDLCSQLRAPGDARLVPLRLGYRYADVRRWVEQGGASQLRNVLLLSDGAAAMPEVRMAGAARGGSGDTAEPLQLEWRGQARWLGDAGFGQIEEGASGQVALRQQGWLLWGAGSALHIERRANALCPQAGELVLQMYRLPGAEGRAGAVSDALVAAFPARGKPVTVMLAAGRYQVPSAPPAALEDQTLFQRLQEHGLVRVSASGAIELAPRDLPQWAAAPASARAAALDGWKAAVADPDAARLLKRLYYQADGAYVRQQVDIHNSERRLLAWRVPAGDTAQWNAESGAPLATSSRMPLAASRLFAALPQGWGGWTRVAYWPLPLAAQAGPAAVGLVLPLARPAVGGEALRLMVAGRVLWASGAGMRLQPVCSGRACATAADVQAVFLTVQPGARSVRLEVQPLAVSAPEDRKYRHLRVENGKAVWQPLSTVAAAPSAEPSPVLLQDRNGSVLWADGAPSGAAASAGLATLLGVNAGHASSIAGMLGRLPLDAASSALPTADRALAGLAAPGMPGIVGGPHAGGLAGAGASLAVTGAQGRAAPDSAAPPPGVAVSARLTLDLPLQALAQQVLDCVGMRRGRWDGRACIGGHAAPEGRHAGLVLLDTENGDVLAAAGAGAGVVDAANWAEVRDFDRSNPARSPLRLPALQHDGGAHQSPGSTFKVVSALGLELAARGDPQLDQLLGGLPLATINAMARQRGYGFQTDAATYPLDPRLARITNYREQSLDRRAQDGRLGLAQALTYSLNTWFAWSGELSDRSLFGRPDGGAPDLQALDADALDAVRPIAAMARKLGFEQALRLDGGLLPATFDWRAWDALQATPSHIDPIHTRHELRQMAIGLRMQATPLQMALASAAIGQGTLVAPRLLLALGSSEAAPPRPVPLGVRLDRVRAGMKGVVDAGTGAGAFGGPALAALRPALYGKTGTAPSGEDTATVWFTGWLEPGSLPGQRHRLAFAAFVSHSEATGGEHAAPIVAALLGTLARQKQEQKGK
ncbi:penicillin-binding transpeptidase domain-containing protein [Oxalobacteraceae bacterium A2-2]